MYYLLLNKIINQKSTQMSEQLQEELKDFDDNFGKKVVSDYLISKGIGRESIHLTTGKYDSFDMFVEMGNTLHLIEIKNRHSPPKYYHNLHLFGLCDTKYEGMIKAKEKYRDKYKDVRICFIVLTEKDILFYDITNLDVDSLEKQNRLSQHETGSDKRQFKNFYQLPKSIAKINPIKQEHINERKTFYKSKNWL
jgi:hypothetical protein